MKHKLAIMRIAAALCLGTLALSPTGCSVFERQDPITITYNTLYSVETATTASYDAFLDMVVVGEIKRDKVPAVATAYNRFQGGMQVAVAAAQFNWSAPAPADVTTLASLVLDAILKAKGM